MKWNQKIIGILMNKRIHKIGIEVEGSMLTPLRYVPDERYGSFYLYRCRCGTEKVIRKSNVGKTVKSCGCLLRKIQKKFGKDYATYRKGRIPWNKGLTGIKTSPFNHPSHKWKTGKIKIENADGSIEWVKVSDEKIGSKHKWAKLKRQYGIK